MQYNPEIFKAYDIRGIYGKDFGEDFAFELGNKLAQAFLGKTLVIGQDARSSSPDLAQELIRGAREAGTQVISIGLCSTPLFYYSVNRLKADGGIMVTASHNPKEYNGFKVVKEEAMAIPGLELKQIFETKAMVSVVGGSERSEALLDDYIDRLLELAQLPPKLKTKVVINTGGGLGGLVAKRLLEKKDIPHVPLFFEIDGEFKAHSPNPLDPESQEHVIKALREQQAGFGVLFDGDADRVIFMDGSGRRIESDYILLLLAQQLKNPIIVHDLRMSRAIGEFITEWGGTAIRSRVGHTFVKKLMREHQADLGGELSGHFPVKEDYWHYSEASFLIFLKILKLIEESGSSLAQLVAPLRRYERSGEINFHVADKAAVIERIEDAYGDAKIDRLDGITVEYPNWWFNVRASNTEPLLRLVVETTTASELEERVAEITALIEQ